MAQSNQWESWAVIIAVVFGIGSCIQSHIANRAAEKANELSIKANQTAEKANHIASEANNLSQEANEIAKRQFDSNLIVHIQDGALPFQKWTKYTQREIIFFSLPYDLKSQTSNNPDSWFPINTYTSEYGASFFKDYYLLIDNLGSQSLSITDHDFYEFHPEERILPNGRKVKLDSLKRFNIGDTYKIETVDGKEPKLPLNIEPRKPLLFILKVKYLIPVDAWKETGFRFNKKYSYEEVNKKFEEIKKPFFGQWQDNDETQDLTSTNKYYQSFCFILEENDGTRLHIPVQEFISTRIDAKNYISKDYDNFCN